MKRRSELTPVEWVQGTWHRFWMKLSHRFGFCYPEPSLSDPAAVWCHWCGMRGKRLIVREAEIAAAIAAKQASHERKGRDS